MARLLEWLEGLNIDAQKKAQLKESMGAAIKDHPEVDKEFEASVLRQGDYSRVMNEATALGKKLQADFDSKNQDLERYKATLISTRGKLDGQFKKVLQERDTALAQLQQHQTAIKKLADEHGFSAEELGLSALPAAGTPIAAPAAAAADPDAPRYVTLDDLYRETASVPLFQAQIEDVAAEYHQLFGKPFPSGEREKLAAKAIKDGKGPRDIAPDIYGFTARRSELAAEETKANEARIRADERTIVTSEIMSNAARGGVGQPGANSPALRFSERHQQKQTQDVSHLLHAAQSMETLAQKALE